ncbi:GNAT family N-acetyltransferase [Vibrio cholerae]|nr:GNAT family N-acetyltransferase [Vibrio cholerae]
MIGKFSGMKILSDRLMMSQISADDWTLFYELHTDPAVISLCFDQPSVLEIESKFQSRLEHWTPDSEHWLCLVISELKTGHKVGITGFCVRNGVAEVGFMLLPSFYGNGYGTESLQALIDYSEKHFGLEGFMAVVTEGNVGSEKVLAKSGFTLHRIVPDAYEIGGQRYADHVYIMGKIVT